MHSLESKLWYLKSDFTEVCCQEVDWQYSSIGSNNDLAPTLNHWATWHRHYNGVIMTTIASQITSLAVVYSTVYSEADQRKHQRSASVAFVWGIHRDRWIPHTKGQLREKCFHLMTSSWISEPWNSCMGHSLLTRDELNHMWTKRFDMRTRCISWQHQHDLCIYLHIFGLSSYDCNKFCRQIGVGLTGQFRDWWACVEKILAWTVSIRAEFRMVSKFDKNDIMSSMTFSGKYSSTL